MLRVEALRVAYGHIPVVFGVDLDVAAGEIVALLGANGAGKTTTLRAISGIVRPTSGAVTFAGKRIDGTAAERIARLGVVHVPEGRGVFPSLLVDETLRLAGRGLPRNELASTLTRVYELFPRLDDRRRQAVGQLSGGERQMVALSRALLSKPTLLMIDEPSQGLAPIVCDQLFEVIGKLARDEGIAVLLVEQFVTRALALASRAYVLTKGEVSFAGTAAKLAADESFIASSYLGEVDDRAFAATLAPEDVDLAKAARRR
ncbi:MAG: ABC transporter ATP-binding protein [Actinobacteria bacterium]|nr:ABC transporter ATP-binding protein [Actinomycetota bacterium]